jgi:tetratricopeptide (TPR) repeat protein
MFRNDERFACALQALERGDFSGAEAAFGALLEACTELAERAFLLNKRGVARVRLEQRDRAWHDFEAALEARPAYAPALTNLGNLLLEDGDVQAAIAHYERAIASDAGYAVAHLNLGVAYKRAGRIAESVRELRRSQQLEERARVNASFSSTRARPR